MMMLFEVGRGLVVSGRLLALTEQKSGKVPESVVKVRLGRVLSAIL